MSDIVWWPKYIQEDPGNVTSYGGLNIFRRVVPFVGPLEGMVIGGVTVTSTTSIDYDQWEDGKPWHTKRDADGHLIKNPTISCDADTS